MDKTQLNSSLKDRLLQTIEEHLKAETVLDQQTKDLKIYYDKLYSRTDIFLRDLEESPYKKLLNYMLSCHTGLDDIRRSNMLGNKVDSREQDMDITVQMEGLQEEWENLKAKLRQPEFKTRLDEGRRWQIETSKAIRKLRHDCYFLLCECENKMKSFKVSVASLSDYVNKCQRPMQAEK